MSQPDATPQRMLTARADEIADPGLITALEAAAPAALLLQGTLIHARREDLARLRQLTAVLTDRPDEISRTNLDGAHIEPPRAIKAERARFSSLNLGVGGLKTRHGAMQAGEEGADYVAFGTMGEAPDEAAFEGALALAAWWAGVMTIPCVIMAGTRAEAEAAADGGVDFIACRWQDAADVFNGK